MSDKLWSDRAGNLSTGEHGTIRLDPDHDRFVPIDDAARNGDRLLVKAGDDYAAACWTGDMWAYPTDGARKAWHQLDFEPTHYRPKADPGRSTTSARI